MIATLKIIYLPSFLFSYFHLVIIALLVHSGESGAGIGCKLRQFLLRPHSNSFHEPFREDRDDKKMFAVSLRAGHVGAAGGNKER